MGLYIYSLCPNYLPAPLLRGGWWEEKIFRFISKKPQQLLETLPEYEGPFMSVEGSKSPKDNFSLEV